MFISLSTALSPSVSEPLRLWYMTNVTSNPSYLPSISNIWPLPNYTAWWQKQVSKYILTKFIYFQAIRAKKSFTAQTTVNISKGAIQIRYYLLLFARGVCANISVCAIVNPTWVKTLLTSTWPYVRCSVGTEEGNIEKTVSVLQYCVLSQSER